MQRTRILLIEDHPDDQFLTLRTLRKFSLTNVTVANEGEEAMRLLRGADAVLPATGRSSLPGLILLDLRMPKVDGFEFLATLRADERTSAIPVVVLSSSPQERDRLRCRELGAAAYLEKPLEMHALNRVLRQIGLSPPQIPSTSLPS